MSSVVLDTNVVVSLLDRKDVHHQRAVDLIQRLENEQKDFVLMDCVLVEIYSVIARRSREKGYDLSRAFSYVREIESTYPVIPAYKERVSLHAEVLSLIIDSSGKLSYHDALIALVMKRRGIKEIATFDRDFEDLNWLHVVS